MLHLSRQNLLATNVFDTHPDHEGSFLPVRLDARGYGVTIPAFFGIDLPDNVPATIQDRAYTSPVWYTP